MSEVGLGECDASPRWVGVSPHRVVLSLGAVASAGWWAVAPHSPGVALALGVALAALALPGFDGASVAQVSARLGAYFLRSHWSSVSVLTLGDETTLWAGGAVALRGFELLHRGRLDLSGRDVALAGDLAKLLDALGSSRAGRHVSVHVIYRPRPATLLALPSGVSAPSGWVTRPALVLEAVGLGRASNEERALKLPGPLSAPRDGGVFAVHGDPGDLRASECGGDRGEFELLERVTYLRGQHCVARVYRIRDFSGASSGALVERWARASTTKDLSIHFDVVASGRARRLAARAVHRAASDDVVARRAGFRRSARVARSGDRLAERERLTAEGRALVRLAVYAVVWAPSLTDLATKGRELSREAEEAGLRLERGVGRQVAWFRAQLPGGVGW